MRGEHCPATQWGWTLRITPAYAGRTSSWPTWLGSSTDHPRVCGENVYLAEPTSAPMGSPPRMRGELVSRHLEGEALQDHPRVCGENRRRSSRSGSWRRITPAYAGRTRATPRTPPGSKDHPRVCGENLVKSGRLTQLSGSPPRMRGEPPPTPGEGGRPGITPAYAGRTSIGWPLLKTFGDHPRVCGENSSGSASHAPGGGSPPRMRGELHIAQSEQNSWRITPAYAGRTSPNASPIIRARDHPRVCGENSPLSGQRSPLRLDHPRVCGENQIAVLLGGRDEGSPPRMRGELSVPCNENKVPGITPAYAGRTRCSQRRCQGVEATWGSPASSRANASVGVR
ncbi:Hypothetical protein PFR_JS9-2_2014 [Propionibacterium freudenreichii]|nr:Hypothetical protein PFR_JS9-1_2016 [Propionibacterium freudenreichii]SCQ70569.1 Hypothetical protein PFR_JS9-2_2014 [Propionibacterium freudenreichii]